MTDDGLQSPSGASGSSADVPGRSMADVLALPDDLRQLFTWVRRQGEVGLGDVVAHTGRAEDVASTMLTALVEQHFMQQIDSVDGRRYRPRLSSRPSRPAFGDVLRRLENA